MEQRRKIRARERFGGRIAFFPPSSLSALEKSSSWEILEEREKKERPKKRGPYKKKKVSLKSIRERFNLAAGLLGRKVKV